jgi:hypothetical protein
VKKEEGVKMEQDINMEEDVKIQTKENQVKIEAPSS